jgi:PAS domain S-box-containing protein
VTFQSPIADAPFSDDTQLLRAIVDTAAGVMVGLRPDCSVFLWNRAAETLYQTPREQALGTNYVERFIAAEHRDAVRADIAAVLAGKLTQNFEDDSILPDGSRRTLLWNVTRLLDASGTSVGILAIGQDITRSKEAEERFRVLFEHLEDGVLLSDESGVVDCNPAVLRILGVSKETLVGRRPAEFSPPTQPDGQQSQVKALALGRETLERGALTFEWLHRRPDGSEVPVDVSVRHAKLAGKRISVVSWHDLTARKSLEREQLAVQSRLLQAQKLEAVGQLAGGVAHDFNNLLTAVRNGVELAIPELPSHSAALEDLTLSLEAVDRAAALTRQLLAYSRRETARPTRIDLAALASSTLRLLRTSIPSEVTIIEDCARPVHVRADRSQLEQVIMNLLLNGRDAVRANGTLELHVYAHEESGRARLTMRDDGVGMDSETQRRIFEPFFTTKNANVGGTGLGLAVVYGIVSELGGEINVSSKPGAGSTFDVLLPLDVSADDVIPEPSHEPPSVEQFVLLVEDEDVVRLTTARLLSRMGWSVILAEDGEAGWTAFQTHRHKLQLVITDVRMPRLDGLALARRIREADPHCPVLVASGYDRVDGPQSADVEGTAFLAKPYSLGTLREAISRILPASERQRPSLRTNPSRDA